MKKLESLGQKIRHLRFNQGETTQQVADAVGITVETFKQIENSVIYPETPVLKRIAAHYEVTPEYLVNENNIKIRLFAALWNFFYHNRGTAFRFLTALGLIAAILFPVIDFIQSFLPDDSGESSTVITNSSIKNVITGDYNTIIQYENEKTDSIIELIDVSIDESEEFPKLDIKLRNSGDTIAFLYKMEIFMEEYFQMNNIHLESYSPAEPSYNYDFVVKEDRVQSFNISQKIPGNDIDRFTVTLTTNTGDPYVPAVCVFSIRLYYNQSEYVESGYITLPINNPKRLDGKYIWGTDHEAAYENYINLKRINAYDAVKSDCFVKIYDSYESHKDEILRNSGHAE